jgi:hypothetical protein
MPKEMGKSKSMGMSNGRGGHLYTQTNEGVAKRFLLILGPLH